MNRRIFGASPPLTVATNIPPVTPRDVTPDSDWHATDDALACPTASRSGTQLGCGRSRPTAPPACATNRSGSTPPRWPTQVAIVAVPLHEPPWRLEDLLQRRAVGHRPRGSTPRSDPGRSRSTPPSDRAGARAPTDHPTHRFVGRQERLVLLHHHRPEGEQAGLPAPGLGGASGQVDPVLAVLRRPAATLLLAGIDHRRQRPQGRIAPQSTDHRHARSRHPLQERPL